MAKHTKTPWRVGDRNETRGVPILAGADAETVRVTAVYGSDALPDSQDEVNATFIVQAVNAHDALVAAVGFALKYHRMMIANGGKTLPAQLVSSLEGALKLTEDEHRHQFQPNALNPERCALPGCGGKRSAWYHVAQ